MGLNEHQQRRLEVSLGIIDRTLMEIERYYLSPEPLKSELAEITSELTLTRVRIRSTPTALPPTLQNTAPSA